MPAGYFTVYFLTYYINKSLHSNGTICLLKSFLLDAFIPKRAILGNSIISLCSNLRERGAGKRCLSNFQLDVFMSFCGGQNPLSEPK